MNSATKFSLKWGKKTGTSESSMKISVENIYQLKRVIQIFSWPICVVFIYDLLALGMVLFLPHSYLLIEQGWNILSNRLLYSQDGSLPVCEAADLCEGCC